MVACCMTDKRGDVLGENHECYEWWWTGPEMVVLTSTEPLP
jgi:hypothetical protein